MNPIGVENIHRDGDAHSLSRVDDVANRELLSIHPVQFKEQFFRELLALPREAVDGILGMLAHSPTGPKGLMYGILKLAWSWS